jgi:hypothetical protein
MNQRVLDEVQAAEKLKVKVQTMRNWRHLGKGPAYLKVGERAIRYLESDIDAFLTGNRIIPRAA